MYMNFDRQLFCVIALLIFCLVMICIKWSETAQKICTGQCGRNNNPVAMLPHAAVVFCMQPFNSGMNISLCDHIGLTWQI